MNREYEEICDVIDRTPDSKLRQERLKKHIKKTLQRVGSLDYNLFPPDFRWNLCAARLRLGRFDNWDGWEFRSDWSITFQGINGYQMKVPKWDGSPVKKLLVCGEQGIGDEILFASALPELIKRVGHDCIEFQTYPRILDLMERSFRIKCIPRQRLGALEGDAVVALADLFMFYRRDKSHFPGKPFLKPREDLVLKWKEKLDGIDGKTKIGIGWKARHGDLEPRDLMFEDATYINLQYLTHPDGDWTEALPEGVVDFHIDPIEDMENHLALISVLDKVVTVTQTTVHEAGAVGTECHAIRPAKGTGEVNNALWYYSVGNCDSVIYNSVKIWNTPKDYEEHARGSRRTQQLS